VKVTVFYSWQSDLPNNTNRGFIQSVIEKAIQTIKRDETFDLDICLERDTQGEPGSPNIVATILQKIEDCDIFVADISVVTRDLEEGQRFSPNPNVMIELGYAIKSIGWERIILFCNEIYGTGDKLPFDIQQHRRIGYELRPDDEKPVVRERLAKICRTALAEIADGFYKSRKGKLPELWIDWTRFDYVICKGESPPVKRIKATTDILELTKADAPESVDSIEATIAKEIEEVNQINGSFDPKWKRKVEVYIKDCDEFIRQIKSQTGRINYFLHRNSKHAVRATLNLHNSGSSPASEIKIKVALPDWIVAFENFPDDDKIPKKPEKPFPEIPNPFLDICSYSNRPWIDKDLFIPTFSPIQQKITSECYIEGDEIIMWADRLPHKHELTLDNDTFYILAMPDSKLGEHALETDIFCVEYDDWEETDLFIKIKADNEDIHPKQQDMLSKSSTEAGGT
jgi:hypothetical protein